MTRTAPLIALELLADGGKGVGPGWEASAITRFRLACGPADPLT